MIVADNQDTENLPTDPILEVNTRPEPPPPASFKERSWLLLVMTFSIVVDHFSKLFIEVWLPIYTSHAPFPQWADFFRFTHTSNTGAAFGLFQNNNVWFGLIAAIVGGVILAYNYQLPAGHWLLRTALGLQLGGALGNMIDRIRLGHVTDFMDFGPWPVWNVADLSIVSGVVILAVLMYLEQRQAKIAPPLAPLPLSSDEPVI